MIDPDETAAHAAQEIDAEIDKEIEQALRGAFGGDIQLAAAIHQELATRTGLGRYFDEVREPALLAIKAFPDLDLEDRVQLRKCQNAVRLYLHVFGFIKQGLVNGDHAEAVLARQHGMGLPDHEPERRDDG